MARPNKAQHTIPRTYLESFTADNGQVWVADKNLRLYSQKPHAVLREKDFYTMKFASGGGTLAIETQLLGSIETAFSTIYQKKIASRIRLSKKDKAVVSIFIASMFERVPARRESLSKFFDDVRNLTEHMRNLPKKNKRALANLPLAGTGKGIPADEFLKMGKDIRSLHSSMLPRNVALIAPHVFAMNWAFMDASISGRVFITSDNPCSWVCPDVHPMYCGLASKTIEISLPLSPSLSLLCGWQLEKDLYYVPVAEKYVQRINWRTMRQGNTLISNSKEFLENRIAQVKQKMSASK